ISALAAQPSDINNRSNLRKLLDANGGAINFKRMPLRSAQDFSDFVQALAGKGDHSWVPHQDKGMQVLRKPRAKYVVTTNEGPPTHVIMWHNEYTVSPSYPAYVIFFYLTPPASGGETPIVSSVALYDRLEKDVPEFLEGCKSKGLSYTISHTASQVDGTVGGNGVYKTSAFGPIDGTSIDSLSEEEKRRGVERRIQDLAEIGGWHEESQNDANLPNWQRRGFDWNLRDDGGVDITHRVPGVRMHPTKRKGTIFNAVATRYTNAKIHNTFEPPHTFIQEDGSKGVYLVRLPVTEKQFAGLEKNEPIPKPWLEKMDELQNALASKVAWETGDILIIDSFAVQHARWPWSGDRKILASFWDE
ncbi:hypothetical protein BDD12DRAFT_716791, partial [Trichophaea hybrida]